MSKRRKFKLKIKRYGEQAEKFEEVFSTDYDDDLGLVRYDEILYDMETGLWVVTLRQIWSNGGKSWSGCGRFPQITKTQMLPLVRTNAKFLERLKKQQDLVMNKYQVKRVNCRVRDLFAVQEEE